MECYSTEQSQNYKWNQKLYLYSNPPYFDEFFLFFFRDDLSVKPLKDGRFCQFGDYGNNVDHTSPAGNIARNSPAARYLTENGVGYQEFKFMVAAGNHGAAMRGTFANIRIKNELADGKIGGYN